MIVTQAQLEEALQALGVGSLSEFAFQYGLEWMTLNDPVDRRIIELAVIREARHQEIFFSMGE
jgi:hypothetical protein